MLDVVEIRTLGWPFFHNIHWMQSLPPLCICTYCIWQLSYLSCSFLKINGVPSSSEMQNLDLSDQNTCLHCSLGQFLWRCAHSNLFFCTPHLFWVYSSRCITSKAQLLNPFSCCRAAYIFPYHSELSCNGL